MPILEEYRYLALTRVVFHTSDTSKSLIFNVKSLHLILVYFNYNWSRMIDYSFNFKNPLYSIAGLHVTSRRPCWWSRTLGTKLYFHVNSWRKYSFVLTPNMAALSRGCKPRIKEIIFLCSKITILITLLRQTSPFSLLLYRFHGAPCLKGAPQWLIHIRKN